MAVSMFEPVPISRCRSGDESLTVGFERKFEQWFPGLKHEDKSVEAAPRAV